MKLKKRSQNPGAPYYAWFRVKGIAHQYCTKTDNLQLAKRRAEDYKQCIVREEFALVDSQKRAPKSATFKSVWELMAESHPDIGHNTFLNYKNTMRTILRASSVELDENTPLSVLCSDVVERYRRKLGHNLTDTKKRTFNATYRQAKSIFNHEMRRLLKKHGVEIPGLDDFMTCKTYKVSGTVPPRITQEQAEKVEAAIWKEPDPELRKALILMLFAGLRNIEVMNARWDWLREVDGRWFLVVGDAAYSTKGKRSRTIALATEIALHLRQAMSNPVHIIGGMTPTERRETCYRRAPQFCRMCGVEGFKPAYELRKWFGSMMATRYGLFATQILMGHKTPQVTSDSYAGLVTLPEGIRPSLGLEIIPPVNNGIQGGT